MRADVDQGEDRAGEGYASESRKRRAFENPKHDKQVQKREGNARNIKHLALRGFCDVYLSAAVP